ncbi:GH92 family glycosyl hydrolase [Seonamhaeicola sp.]|uniref:GH92 family glycosyl hydrolase n=1 Tax=Seonamhaeicola sp. TaxID=1912245 RepID=UPI00261F287D|nr:GH92 family glycosyl hydrolase [Seonamhaeicola sp.]
MKRFYTLMLCALVLCCNQGISPEKEETGLLVDLVNVYIGTTGEHISEYGGMIPGVTMPFGMTQWSPMTQENRISQACYRYDHDTIIGFTGTHQPAIWMGDYGFISLMPQTGDLKVTPNQRGLPFKHEDEIATPYFYSVKMEDKQAAIETEITASTRCGFFKFKYDRTESPGLMIEMSRLEASDGFVKIDTDNNEIIGYNPDRHNLVYEDKMGPDLEHFKGYFVLKFDVGFDTFGTWMDSAEGVETFNSKKEQSGAKIGAYVKFLAKPETTVKVKIASSFISIEQARQNLEQEIPDWDFDAVKEHNKRTWEDYLGRIAIEGGTHDQQVNFYTAMYHALLYPRIFSEYGSYYSAFDDTIHQGISYNDYSLWDTFRALHPLLLFTAPEHVDPMIRSLLQMYDEGGWMPKWPNPSYTNIMIGTHADAVIADAYVKGFRDFDVNKAYEAMYKNAMTPPDGDRNKLWADRADWTSYEARGGLSWYKQLGYVPADRTKESVSRTLEFAYDDFCVAQMAQALGKYEDQNMFMLRSKNYKNLYNPQSGFMQARLANGTFYPGDPKDFKAFTEGSPWTYLFCAMQDVDGLINTMGGKEAFAKKLDENFDLGHYRHDNEPGHHYAYLYNYCDQAWKTQEKIRAILHDNYKNQPDGLSGNDDCGQMSAWYIFSSMGFYPVTPGSDSYAIGTPLFEKTTIKLGEPYKQKTFTILANNVSDKNKYIKSATLDGRVLKHPFIKHSDIVNGEHLIFEMDSIPHMNWK